MEDCHIRRCAAERGQILPLVALLIAAAACALLAIGALGRQVADRAAATTAADTAALAAVSSGASAADAVASANGAVMTDVERLPDGDVRVRVERDGIGASARARAIRTTQTGRHAPLAPALRAAVRRAEGMLGRPVPIDEVHAGGAAFDVPASFVETLRAVAADAGLCVATSSEDPEDPEHGGHVEICGRGFTSSAHG